MLPTDQIDRREKNSVDNVRRTKYKYYGCSFAFHAYWNEREIERLRIVDGRNRDFQSSYFVSFPATMQRTNRSPFFPPPPIFLSPLSLSLSLSL